MQPPDGSVLYWGVENRSRQTGPLSVMKSNDVPLDVGTAWEGAGNDLSGTGASKAAEGDSENFRQEI